MAGKAEIIKILHKTLSKRGWHTVKNKNSGMLWKNGCLFVFGPYGKYQTVEDGSLTNYHCETGNFVENGNNSWFVEWAGWMIGSGTISRTLGDSALFGEQSSRWQEWLDVIEEIDGLTHLSWEKLITRKVGLVAIATEVECPTVCECNGKFRDTGMFIVKKDYAGLKEGNIYHVLKVKEGIIILGQLKPDCSGYVKGAEIRASGKTLIKLENIGIIQAAEVTTLKATKVIKQLQKFVKDELAPFPPQLCGFGLDTAQLVMLGSALKQVINITPLLNRKLYASAEFISVLRHTTQDLSGLLMCEADKEACTALVPAIRSGYNIRPMLASRLDAGFIKLQYDDMLQALEESAFKNRQKNMDEDLVEAVKRISTFGVMEEIREDKALLLLLKYYTREKGLETVNTFVMKHGIVGKNTISVRWSDVSERKQLYAFFGANGLLLEDGTVWSEFLSRIFERAMYLIFHRHLGILISDDAGLWGRDYNSIVLYDQTYLPIWRAVYINEEFIKYGCVNL